ncbi:hypothetical protein SAMN02982927_03352 [Sporolactobacillus nakayamae]|uniref:Uncharacterized protein n=1 Tax=Sporolactobacillus nakayamae TaxID=269670 RepID=A0A1I2W5L9_9BACL|nr:hypothetical protein SAMN02982927_03352 [Sporolactobacillus nakayamae]
MIHEKKLFVQDKLDDSKTHLKQRSFRLKGVLYLNFKIGKRTIANSRGAFAKCKGNGAFANYVYVLYATRKPLVGDKNQLFWSLFFVAFLMQIVSDLASAGIALCPW